MKLNCDLGESFGAWQMPVDADIMKFIDQANIACGFHAGDPVVMKQALYLAKNSNVEIGAHHSISSCLQMNHVASNTIATCHMGFRLTSPRQSRPR